MLPYRFCSVDCIQATGKQIQTGNTGWGKFSEAVLQQHSPWCKQWSRHWMPHASMLSNCLELNPSSFSLVFMDRPQSFKCLCLKHCFFGLCFTISRVFVEHVLITYVRLLQYAIPHLLTIQATTTLTQAFIGTWVNYGKVIYSGLTVFHS